MKLTKAQEKDESLKKASRTFCSIWKLNREIVEQKEKEFGEKMQRITSEMFEQFSPYAEEESPAYDFQSKYRALEELVEAYQEMFHIVSVTIGWKDEK
jgi:hypothetical protein